MKKTIVIALTLMMMLVFSTAAFASEPVDPDVSGGKGIQNSEALKAVPGYDEWFSLREAGLALKEEVKANNETLKSMAQTIKQSGNEEAIALALTYKDPAKQLKDQQKALGETQKANWQAMKTALEAGDSTQAATVMQDIITTRQALNDNLQATIDLQEEVISALNALGI